jgi:hypothetical protein
MESTLRVCVVAASDALPYVHLPRSRHTVGWYPLDFSIPKTGTHSGRGSLPSLLDHLRTGASYPPEMRSSGRWEALGGTSRRVEQHVTVCIPAGRDADYRVV